MIDDIILTVSDVERSLAFYEASLATLNIKFFMPYKGENGHPDLWGLVMAREHSCSSSRVNLILGQFIGDSWLRTMPKSMSSTRRLSLLGAKDNISPRARMEYCPGRILPRLLCRRCLRPGRVFDRGCS
jgi:hypothetical protein